MKKITFLMLFCALWCSSMFAQETVFKSEKNLRIHLSPLLEISRIDDLAGISAGAGTAIMWKNFYTGLYYLNHNSAKTSPANYDLRFQHGGLWTGYIMNPDKMLHLHAGLKLGYGSIVEDYIVVSNNINRYSSDLFIVNPTIGAELNLTKIMKIGLNAGYRLNTAVSVVETDSYLEVQDSQGMTFEASLRLGNF